MHQGTRRIKLPRAGKALAVACLASISLFVSLPPASWALAEGDSAAAPAPAHDVQQPITEIDPLTGEKAFAGRATVTQVVSGQENISQAVDELTRVALERNPMTSEIDKKIDKHKGLLKTAIKKTKDSLNFAFFYRGDGPSSDAGDIILDERLKIQDKPSADYARQRLADRMHLAVVSQVLQLAEGIGNSDKSLGKEQVESSLNNLRALVGDDAAAKAFDVLTVASANNVSDSVYNQKSWSISQRQNKVRQIIEAAVAIDPVIAECKNKVYKYNHHSRKYIVSTKIVKTTLGIGALTPSIVGTVCALSEYAFIMATGGPEEDKIIKELYLDKCLQSHGNVLTEKAHMAIDGYQTARFTRNPALLFCTESLIGQMTGPTALATVLDKAPTTADKDKTTEPAAGEKTLEADSQLVPASTPAADSGRKLSDIPSSIQ